MEAIGKGVIIFILMLKSFSPSIGNRVPSSGSYIPDPNRPHVLRIAVIPFDNVSSDTNATDRLLDTLVTYILHTQVISVVDPFLVEQKLFDLKIRKASQITTKTAKELKEALGIDAILIGKITAYQIDSSGGDSIPVIALNVRLLDLETLGIIWSSSLVRQGNDKSVLFDIGRIDTLSDLNQLVANDLASELGKQVKSALSGYVKKSGAAMQPAALPAAAVPIASGQATATATKEIASTQTEQPADKEQPANAGQPAAPAQPGKNLLDLLPEIQGFSRDSVNQKSHGVPTAETTYYKEKIPIIMKIYDCGGESVCKALGAALVTGASEAGPEIEKAVTSKSTGKMGSAILSVQSGRYLIIATGGDKSLDDMKNIATEIVKLAAR